MSQWLQHALVCACLLCLSLAPASAEDPDRDYLLDIWGTDDGLPSATVTGITQTKDGYLWCSTHDGAVRFDGVRFLRIGPDEPADQDANRVLCLHADRRGQLWLGTDGAGLFRYDNGKFTVFAEPRGASANSIRTVCCRRRERNSNSSEKSISVPSGCGWKLQRLDSVRNGPSIPVVAMRGPVGSSGVSTTRDTNFS